MKKLLFLIAFPLLLTSCEHRGVSMGRKAYKKYYRTILKDPDSFKVYNEEAKPNGDTGAIFIIDYGAKNGYGAYVRKTDSIRTFLGKVLSCSSAE